MVEVTDMTRPIVGIENRTAQEVFDIMCDRIRRASPAEVVEPVAWMHPTAGWTSANYSSVLPHCFNDGPKPVPLYLHPPQQEPARLREALDLLRKAEEYVIDGVTNAKQLAEMNAAYPLRAPRFEAELAEVRKLYADIRAALAEDGL